ncbi:MAG: ParB/RepB/Spo0J family partition protein [Syntrophorhabdaceae bacterium]|nr:ParB/RepB/Spo0J family partition protein [Syntrophorhabdaceae bacterium]MDD4196832.1 ParB/RepB/Spo0J family partition protein [Syntrophorhabdaceae bacterium]
MKKDPLGRGLSAILKDIEDKGTSRSIAIDQIVPNPSQPRIRMDDRSIDELAASISEKGILQPILVKNKGKLYEIIAGERRYRAAILAGLREIPAIIRDVDDREALEIALMENLQREDLNPLEIAAVYEKFIDEFAYTHEELAKKMGVDRSSVTNCLRLLKLPEWVRDIMAEGRLTQGHGRVLLSLKNEREQKKFVDRVLREHTSVRELEREVRKKVVPSKEHGLTVIEEALIKALQTKVNISMRKNRGKIIIEFYSREDLDRLTELIAREP